MFQGCDAALEAFTVDDRVTQNFRFVIFQVVSFIDAYNMGQLAYFEAGNSSPYQRSFDGIEKDVLNEINYLKYSSIQ